MVYMYHIFFIQNGTLFENRAYTPLTQKSFAQLNYYLISLFPAGSNIYELNYHHLDVHKIHLPSIGLYELQLESGWTNNKTLTFRTAGHMTEV